MSKLMDQLNQQAKNPKYKNDALQCIKLYNWLKEIDGGKVWSSRWTMFTKIKFLEYPNEVYQLNNLGKEIYRLLTE